MNWFVLPAGGDRAVAIMEGEEQTPLRFEDKWKRIQENTFRNWINQQLRDTSYQIDSLQG